MVDQNANSAKMKQEDDGNQIDSTMKRFDRLGNPIIKVNRALLKDETPNKNKRDRKEDKKKTFRVTFLDKVEAGQPLARHHLVQSYKKYNAMNTFDPLDGDNSQSSSHCCSIF